MTKENVKELLLDACALEEKQITEELINKVDSLFEYLTDREERVIRLKYGLDDGKPRSLLEIATMFGVSREEIRQVARRATIKLRVHSSRIA